MEHINKIKSEIEQFCKQKNPVTDLLTKVQDATKVSKVNQVYALIGFLAVYLIVGYGSGFLVNFIGFLYPAYASLKAIESQVKDDDTKWLTYWVVYSVFSLVEVFADIVLFWIPFYSFLKCIFLCYLMAPIENNGSVFLYHSFIKPYVLKHESSIDKKINQAKDLAGDMADKAKRRN